MKQFSVMTPDEQQQWVDQFSEFLKKQWPELEVICNTPNVKLTIDSQKQLAELMQLLVVWPFAEKFCAEGLKYGDYASRAYRLPRYVSMVQKELGMTEIPTARRGRPASAETIAKREAAAKADKRRDVYLNPVQQRIFYAGARDVRVVAARRFGKTDGVLGPRRWAVAQSLPQGAGGFLGTSRKQLFSRTVPGMIAAIERFYGMKEGVHLTPDEQQQWVDQFSEFLKKQWPELEVICNTPNVKLTIDSQKQLAELMQLLVVWPFAEKFCAEGLKYGDYASRAYRLPRYVSMVQKELGMTEIPTARRGRPASAETIAKREAAAKADKQQQKLFEPEKTPAPTPAAPSIPDTSHGERLHLDQLKWLMSPELAEDVDKIRALRTAAASAAERAKTMSDLKAAPASIEPYTKEAAEATEAYQAIYERVDRELATVHYRLKNDGDYLKKFRERFKKDDVTDVVKLLTPYWQKMQQDAEFLVSVKQIIEQESPEFVAKQKAEAEKKKEVQDILRYLKRKDKAQKPETAIEKFKRLEQLIGKKAAQDYKPLLDKIKNNKK